MSDMWMIPNGVEFHRGHGEELLAVVCDADLAATSRRVRDLRARVTTREANYIAYPQRLVVGFDGSKGHDLDLTARWECL